MGAYDAVYPAAAHNYPSIVVDADFALIVWQKTYSGFGGLYCDILARKYNVYTSAFMGAEQTVSQFIVSSLPFSSTPVVEVEALGSSSSYDMFAVAWRDGNGIKIKRNYEGTWSETGTVDGTNSYSLWPSIGVKDNVSRYVLAWEDSYNETIRYAEAKYDYGWDFPIEEQVSPSGWYVNGRPSLAMVGSTPKPTVAWNSVDNIVEGTSVHVRQRSDVGASGSWSGTITSFSTVDGPGPMNPAIGSYAGNGKHTVVWSVAGNVYAATNNGSTWSGPTLIESDQSGGGYEPNINAQAGSTLNALWRKFTNQIGHTTSGVNPSSASRTDDPVLVNSDVSGNASTALSNNPGSMDNFGGVAVPFRHNRHAILQATSLHEDSPPKAFVAFEIAGITQEGQTVEYADIADSTVANPLSSKLLSFSSSPGALSFSGAIYGTGFAGPLKSFMNNQEPLVQVVLQSTDNMTKTIWEIPYSVLGQIDGESFGEFRKIDVDLLEFSEKDITIQVKFAESKDVSSLIVVDDYLILDQTKSLDKRAENELIAQSEEFLPSSYQLHQNYPNPFNPTTRIIFDLPRDEYVTLRIYDLLGKEIISAAEGSFRAGRHELSVSMDEFPSGSYLYRLVAGEFTDSKRLILLK